MLLPSLVIRRSCRLSALLAFMALAFALSATPCQAQQKWALLIGIDQYQNPDQINPLVAAAADARELGKVLVEAAGFPAKNVRLLTSDGTGDAARPTGAQILFELEQLGRNVKPGDTLFVLFSGHGIEMGGTSYLLPYDTDARTESTLKRTALATADVTAELRRIPAGTLLLAFDMCRNDPRKGSKATGADNVLGAKQARDLAIPPARDGSSGPRTVVTLFSCNPLERSWEWSEKKRGFFSYFLEEGIKGGASDPKGEVRLKELLVYLEETVPRIVQREVGRSQTPYAVVEGTGALDLVLARDRPVAKASDTTKAPVRPVSVKPVVAPDAPARRTIKRPAPVADTLTGDWRKAANERIEWYRKGDLIVKVVDEKGAPVPGAQVQVEQKRHAFRFGASVTSKVLEESSEAEDYRAIFKRFFNYATPESELFWQNPAQLPRGEAMLDWLTRNNIPARGHFLFEANPSRLPSDMISLRGTRLREAVEKRIRDLMTRNRGKVISWDVVHESADGGELLNEGNADLMEQAFHWARKADPQAELTYIDWLCWTGMKEDAVIPRAQKVYERIRQLQTKGAPITNIALEEWIGESNGVAATAPRLLERWERFALCNLPMEIAEFVAISQKDDLQATLLEDALTAAFSHPSMIGFTLWGFWEGAHYAAREGGHLWRQDFSPRPSARVYEQMVYSDWWTKEQGLTSAAGTFHIRAFLGAHEVTVRRRGSSGGAGSEVKRQIEVKKGKDGVTILEVTL